MQVHTTGRSEFPDYLRMLVAGQPGAGKTRFAATFPNPLFANAHGGLTSLADRQVNYVDLTGESDALVLKLLLEGTPEEREARLGFPVDTLVIDTLDEFQRILLAERLMNEKRAETNAGDYGWLGQRMHTIFESLIQLEVNLVVITHLKDVSDGVSGQLYVKPGLAGAFTDQVHQYMDFSLLMQSRFWSEPTDSNLMINGQPVAVGFPEPQTSMRYLRTYSDGIYEWVRDLTGTLPLEVPLNFESDYETIIGYVDPKRESLAVTEVKEVETPEGVDKKLRRRKGGADHFIKDTVKKVQEKKAVEEVVAPTDVECAQCFSKVESEDQVDLSKIRYREPLCSSCFNKRR